MEPGSHYRPSGGCPVNVGRCGVQANNFPCPSRFLGILRAWEPSEAFGGISGKGGELWGTGQKICPVPLGF